LRLEPTKLISTARKLARAGGGERRPRQSDLRRALSTAYYALFHEICFDYANFLVGNYRNAFDKSAWRRAYRSIAHGDLKDRASKTDLSAFCDHIQDFAAKLVDMQEKRHLADYDPLAEFTREETLNEIDQVELVLHNYRSVRTGERRAFHAVLTGFKKKLP
jgi:uncharacterized protein (UPF0332 family)